MKPLVLALSLSMVSAHLTAATLEAQAEDVCDAVFIPNFQRLGDIAYLKGPFHFRCSSGAELRADSGVANQATGEIVLIGNVAYLDLSRSMTAQRATYSRPIRRLYATGNVDFVNRDEGMSIRGPELEYFAAMPERPVSQVNASGRPHLTLRQQGDDPDSEPLEIDADRISILGENDLSAFGNVVVTRTDLNATADEARYQGATENLELRENAVVRGKDSVLSGQVIQAQLENDLLKEVRARTGARLESEDMTVSAPDVQMFFERELIQRTIARIAEGDSTSRAVVLSGTFRLEADSIDALAPDQVLEQVTAIGSARGESVDTSASASGLAAVAVTVTSPGAAGDSVDAPSPSANDIAAATTPSHPLVARDWITGDTIIGYFIPRDSVSDQDSTSVDLRLLVAIGHSQSLYRITEQRAGSQSAPSTARPGINFASAEKISLNFEDGEIGRVELSGVRRGIYLDPGTAEAQTVVDPSAGLTPDGVDSPANLPPVPEE